MVAGRPARGHPAATSAVVLVGLLATTFTACTGAPAVPAGPSASPAPAGPTSGAPAAPSPPRAPTARERTAAVAGNLHAADVPDLTVQPVKGSDGSGAPAGAGAGAQIASCLGLPDPVTNQVLDVPSDELVKSGSQLSSDVTVVADPGQAQQLVHGYATDKGRDCLLASARSANGGGSSSPVADIAIARLPYLPASLTTAFGYRITETTKGSATSTVVYADLVGFVRGDRLVSLTGSSVRVPIPGGTEVRLLALLVARNGGGGTAATRPSGH